MIKIERSFPAPASLEIMKKKNRWDYTSKDLTERLQSDFHDKCYICGLKELQSPQIEHLRPHKNGKYPERKFDWNNLFWACGHCNRIKNNNKYDEGIIDCYKCDPELRLVFKLEDMKVYVYAQNKNDAEAVKTAELIYETFNFYNTGIRECESNAIYKKLTEQMDLLYTVLEEYVKAPGSKDIQNKLKALLRQESAFAVFKRNYIRDHLKNIHNWKSTFNKRSLLSDHTKMVFT